MKQAKQFLYWANKYNIDTMRAMLVLNIFTKKDGFNGWMMQDGSRVNLVNGELVEVI